MAQDSWKLYLGKQELASGKVSDENESTVRLKAGSDQLLVAYMAEDRAPDQTRHFAFFDEKGTELLSKAGGSRAKFELATITSLLEKYDHISLYSWSIPNDPELAARVRVRRVLLCHLSKEAK